MTRRYPHLPGATEFPGAGRELYRQIPGSFDYETWGEGAKLTVTSVPWGVYAPGVMTDKPGFDTVEARDAWFKVNSAKTVTETHVLQTRVRYQINEYVEVGFTFDHASRYNYLIVEYPDAPVPTGTSGIRKWFYHITEIRYDAPSCTTLMLVPDWWVTIAPLMTVNHMILERGHAPVAATDVAGYLAAPLDNSEYLLAPDVDFGERSIVASHTDEVYNSGTVYAVICMRGVPINGDFAGYKMPFDNSTFVNGQPSDWQFAVPAASLAGFLDAWQANAAQAMQAMDALYFCGEKLLSLGAASQVFGHTVYGVSGGTHTTTVVLTQDKFGFAGSIKHLAKLYTYPYSRIEIADEHGNVTELHVEDLAAGSITIESALNGAFPWLTVSAHVTGYGGKRSALSFATARAETFGGGGRWYDTLKSWGVPCYRINQSAAQAYDYHTHFSRAQQANDAETGYSNATASNATAKTNADNSAANMISNNAVSVAANNANVATSVNAGYQGVALSNAKLKTDVQYDIGNSNASFDAEQAQLGVTATNNDSTAQLGMVSGAITTVASAFKGDIGGALGGVSDMVNTGANWSATNASITVSQSNNVNVYNQAVTSAYGKQDASVAFNNSSTKVNNDAIIANATTSNDASTSITSNNAGNVRTNAANTKATGDANAARSRANSYNAIANAVSEAAMGAPVSYGVAQSGEFGNTRPMMLSVNVVTESKSAIKQAATQFLRWGYALNQAWDFDGWNKMRNFTFWQVSDIWATGVDAVPEEGQDAFRRMLYDGVTVWRDPDKIGKVSIYDN